MTPQGAGASCRGDKTALGAQRWCWHNIVNVLNATKLLAKKMMTFVK